MKQNIFKYGVPVLLVISLLGLVLYLVSPWIRCLLNYYGIDPNFLTAILTSMGLLLAYTQASDQKRFDYNLALAKSVEEKGLAVVGKLTTIFNKAEIFTQQLMTLESAILNKGLYKDLNNSLDQTDIYNNLELITSYVSIYFPDETQTWNSIQADLSTVANNFSSTFLNYEENKQELLKGTKMSVLELDNIEEKIIESDSLTQHIYFQSELMRNNIVEILVTNQKNILSKIA